MQEVVEFCRQVLDCQAVCFVAGCPDEDLRHPLLDLLPTACADSRLMDRAAVLNIWREEQVQALCDLAMQEGRMRVLDASGSLKERWQVRSIAAVALESLQGILGVLLLLDGRAERFAGGEERLLYACLSICLPPIERMLWEQARLVVREKEQQDGRGADDEGRSAEAPDQFVKSEFVSMLGHELRAPLSGIKGYAGLLQMYGLAGDQGGPGLTPDQQRHYLDAIMEQTGLLEVLINDLLDVSRAQQGTLALHCRAVDVEALCRRVIQLGQVRADQLAEGKYHLTGTFASPLVPAWVDAERLQQILMNLLENAIKYSPAGGAIALKVGVPENQEEFSARQQHVSGSISITVSDQGIGIPAQHSARLFQPFERLKLPATARIPGMGLGLYITRKLVEAMGGTIELQSCEGCGTDVTIYLPTVIRKVRIESCS